MPGTAVGLTQWRLFLLSFFWFSYTAEWSAILFILAPTQALLIGGDEHKGTTLSILLLIGGVVTLLASPLAGAISDRTLSKRFVLHAELLC